MPIALKSFITMKGVQKALSRLSAKNACSMDVNSLNTIRLGCLNDSADRWLRPDGSADKASIFYNIYLLASSKMLLHKYFTPRTSSAMPMELILDAWARVKAATRESRDRHRPRTDDHSMTGLKRTLTLFLMF